MRILHTSDWHLGQHFYGKNRADEHQAFMAWLIEQIGTYQVDALIVAGDIFDTGTPPSYARTLYHEFIVSMQQANCQLIILGGNHDSVSMLGESQGLLACLHTQVIPGALTQPDNHVLTIKKRDGELGAIVCAIPFLRPRDLIQSQQGESAKDKQIKLGQAIADFYEISVSHARERNQALMADNSINAPLPIIATGHLTTVGASTSESVRDIYIGSLDAFNAQLFPEVDYIALGHIHRPQIVAKSQTIRYSGSPIPLSFDELIEGDKANKSVCLVTFKDGQTEVEQLPVPMFQPMACLKGNLLEIEQQLASFTIEKSQQQNQLNTWLSIEVKEQDFLADLPMRISALCENKAVEVLQLKRARDPKKQVIKAEEYETLAELNVEDVFAMRLAQEQIEDNDLLTRIHHRFSQIHEDVRLTMQTQEEK